MKIIGSTPDVKRTHTGLYSFDKAFENARGETGYPMGSMMEIAGPTHCGKSTFAYCISGILSAEWHPNGISMVALEGYDPQYLLDVMSTTGFDGDIHVIQEETDEESLDQLVKDIASEEYRIGILDSVGAISPIMEQEGDHADSSMGRRAMLMAKFSRKSMSFLRVNPKTIFFINHVHVSFSGFGTHTTGGDTLKYIAASTMRVKRLKMYDDQSFIMAGKVTKNRFGYLNREFRIFIISGYGIHRGLTAIIDCSTEELAKIDRNKVSVGEEKYGHIKDLVEKARAGENEIFNPFIELLNEKGGQIPLYETT